ncbi:MAG TPA: hypothetical protein VF033_08610, partial [Steroidobacteraceae bacterium]
MSGDPEFEDFLRRRRPLFRRGEDDGLEPPPELDRIVLRQAREAIEGERPMRLLGMPRWAAPLAIAATLVVGLAMVFRIEMNPVERVPEVKVESVAQRLDYPMEATPAPPAPPPAPEAGTAPTADGAVVVDLGSPARPALAAADDPAWRRDAKAWQAEIER